MEKTRLSSRAHPQRDEAGRVCTSMTCWRSVGVMAPRRLLGATKQPAYRTWCTRGGGTKADSFSNSSNGDSWMPRVPSDEAQCRFTSTGTMLFSVHPDPQVRQVDL